MSGICGTPAEIGNTKTKRVLKVVLRELAATVIYLAVYGVMILIITVCLIGFANDSSSSDWTFTILASLFFWAHLLGATIFVCYIKSRAGMACGAFLNGVYFSFLLADVIYGFIERPRLWPVDFLHFMCMGLSFISSAICVIGLIRVVKERKAKRKSEQTASEQESIERVGVINGDLELGIKARFKPMK